MRIFPRVFRYCVRQLPCISALLMLAAPSGVRAQDAGTARASAGATPDAPATLRSVRAVRVPNGSVVIDGVLSEAEWDWVQPASGFVQQQPAEGEAATEPTEVRFLYDDHNLYVGALLHDRAPDRLVINELKRDFNARDGDLFVLVLDTFDDKRNSYGFQTNPAGAQRDTQSYDDGRNNNANWDAVWDLKAQITDRGWVLEYAIPFKSLRFPEAEAQTWGVNMFRLIRRKNEATLWSPVPRQFSQFRVSYAGRLEGIEGVRPGRNVRIKPFFTSSVTDRTGSTETDWDAGLDVKMGIGTGLVFDGTFRTDFSQVEADEQQVNLTRFNLFFPEKREFFLENQGSFQMGPPLPSNRAGSLQSSGPPDLVPFFSRTIGLTESGTPLPLWGGVRLSGKVGRNGIGAMNLQTEDDRVSGLPATNFTVARFAREFMENSQASVFYLGKERGDYANRVGGADIRLNIRRAFDVDGLVMQSHTADTGDGVAGRVGLTWDDGPNRASASFTTLGADFRDDLGFIPREGVDITNATALRRLRPLATYHLVREYRPEVTYGRFTKDGALETQTTSASLYMDFADASLFRFTYKFNDETLVDPFVIRSTYTIEPGRYRFRDGEAQFASDRSRALSVNGSFRFGDFWDGTRTGFTAGGRLRVSPKLATSMTYSRDEVALPGADFTTDLISARIDSSFSTRMFLNAFVQYNSQSREVTSNVRFDFIHRPLSNIFLVFNETRSTQEGVPARRALILKVTHLLAF